MAKVRQDSAPQKRGEPSLDITLVIQAQAGDEEAFNQLYLQYFRPVCLFLTYLRYLPDNEIVGIRAPLF